MKNIKSFLKIILIGLIFSNICSAALTYELKAKNFNYSNSNKVLEFDIYLKNTSINPNTDILEYSMGQFIFNIDPAFVNLGNLTYEVLSLPVSDLPASVVPKLPVVWQNQLRIKTVSSIGPGLAPIISSTGSGTFVVRVRLTNSVAFLNNCGTGITWRNAMDGGIYTKLIAYTYPAVGGPGENITNAANHTIEGASNVVNVFSSTPANGKGYPNLYEAFTDINSGTHGSGAITVKINCNTFEPQNAVLNGSVFSSCLIIPTASVSVTALSAVTNLIVLNGASNVTVDGRLNGSGAPNSLTFNGNNFSMSCIQIINSASTDKIYFNTIMNCKSSGISIGNASQDNLIEQNEFKNDITVAPTANFTAIDCLAKGTNDILRNNIHDLTFSAGCTNFVGIRSLSSNVGSTINISNNFITLSQTNIDDMKGIKSTSDVNSVANTVNIYHNTILINGTGSGAATSHGIYEDINIANSNYNQKNNISVNKRTGGSLNAALNIIANTNVNIDADYNCYWADPATGKSGGWNSVYTTDRIPKYQCDAFPNEKYTIFKDVNFVNPTTGDLHLLLPSVKDFDLIGTNVGVTSDIDGSSTRNVTVPYENINVPYMGADEAAPFDFKDINGVPYGTIKVRAYIDNYPLPRTGTFDIEIWECNLAGRTTAQLFDPNGDPFNNITFSSNGIATIKCPSAVGKKFYVMLKNSNYGLIETWSRDLGETFLSSVAGGYLHYNFTTDQSQAFGSSMKTCCNKAFIFNGDITGNGIVDIDDAWDVYINNPSNIPLYDLTYDMPNVVNNTDVCIAGEQMAWFAQSYIDNNYEYNINRPGSVNDNFGIDTPYPDPYECNCNPVH